MWKRAARWRRAARRRPKRPDSRVSRSTTAKRFPACIPTIADSACTGRMMDRTPGIPALGARAFHFLSGIRAKLFPCVSRISVIATS